MKLFNQKINTGATYQKDNLINPKILEVNLIKDEMGVEFNVSKHLLSLFLTLLVASLLVAEIYYGLDWWQKQEEQKTLVINAEYEDVSRQVKNINLNAKDFTAFRDKLALTKNMADSHIYWTDFFNWLEQNTLNSVAYGGFAGDTSGKYSLNATAKTFSDISWQVKAFRDNKFVDYVRVDSGSAAGRDDKSITKATSTDVNFSLDLKVKPDIFYRQAQ
ncbi:MAG: hypothetical protein WCK59_01440 [Candidatus Falkowbacteria bacterium]